MADLILSVVLGTAGGSVSPSYDGDAPLACQGHYGVHQGFCAIGKVIKLKNSSRSKKVKYSVPA